MLGERTLDEERSVDVVLLAVASILGSFSLAGLYI